MPLFKFQSKFPARDRLNEHVARVEREMAKFRAAIAPATNHAEELLAVRTAVFANPTAESVRELIQLEATTAAAAQVTTLMHALLEERHRQLLAENGGRALVEAAMTEATGAIDARRAAVQKNDEDRSRELGTAVFSDTVFKELDRLQAQMEAARATMRYGLEGAIASLPALTSATAA